MATRIEVTWDHKQLAEARRLLGPRGSAALLRVVRRSGSSAIRRMFTVAQRAIREHRRLPIREVKSRIKIQPPKGTRIGDLVWRLDVSGTRIPAAVYPHRQGKRGVRVRINAKGAPTLIQSRTGPRRLGFVAMMASGHRGVFMREGRRRLPLHEVTTASLADVMRKNGIGESVLAEGRRVFASEWSRLLDHELSMR